MPDTEPVQINTSQGQSRLTRLADMPFLKGVVLPALVIIAVVVAGVGTGFFISTGTGKVAGIATKSGVSVAPGAEVKKGGAEAGLSDTATFRDSAQGVLEQGGIDGEGTHHLVRDGGPSQNVYLTSSVVDLEQFLGKKVEVWGETFAAKKAGWLMDVGRIKVIE
ncbi:MAG: hypothetical protein HY377_01970 [Candidatus Blackburnbacteria bacterium]|nr:hypothetical protein [Candidatus Blackburnbacteria bacterium]